MLEIKHIEPVATITGSAEDWEQFRAAVLFVAGACSKDKSLPAFTAAALEIYHNNAGGLSAGLVSTDRFRMHAVNLSGDFEELRESGQGLMSRSLIDGAKLAGAVKVKRVDSFELSINHGAGWSLAAGDSITLGEFIGADFPDFRQIWRGVSDTVAPKNISINPKILGGTLAVIDKAYPGRDNPTRINFTGDELRPILLDNFNASARALVMPCRVI